MGGRQGGRGRVDGRERIGLDGLQAASRRAAGLGLADCGPAQVSACSSTRVERRRRIMRAGCQSRGRGAHAQGAAQARPDAAQPASQTSSQRFSQNWSPPLSRTAP